MRSARSRASLGRPGLSSGGWRNPSWMSHCRSPSPCCCQPSMSPTCAYSPQTHASSSGSMTTAAERASHPFWANFFSTVASSAVLGSSLPHPSRSKMTKANSACLNISRKNSWHWRRTPGSRFGWTKIVDSISRIPKRAGLVSNPWRPNFVFLSAVRITKSNLSLSLAFSIPAPPPQTDH